MLLPAGISKVGHRRGKLPQKRLLRVLLGKQVSILLMQRRLNTTFQYNMGHVLNPPSTVGTHALLSR